MRATDIILHLQSSDVLGQYTSCLSPSSDPHVKLLLVVIPFILSSICTQIELLNVWLLDLHPGAKMWKPSYRSYFFSYCRCFLFLWYYNCMSVYHFGNVFFSPEVIWFPKETFFGLINVIFIIYYIDRMAAFQVLIDWHGMTKTNSGIMVMKVHVSTQLSWGNLWLSMLMGTIRNKF